MPQDNGKGRSSEADRYREAATQALEMLDWCIGFLVGIRKEGIAARLAENRSNIRKRLMDEPPEPPEPLPTSKE
jgi:hypothetical protein